MYDQILNENETKCLLLLTKFLFVLVKLIINAIIKYKEIFY